MDLLEIRKRAKQQRKEAEPRKSEQPWESSSALEPPVKEPAESPPPAVEPAAPQEESPTTEQDDMHIQSESPAEAWDAWSETIDTHEDPGGVDGGDSDFLDLASEELYRHTYDLDEEEEEQREVLLCRIADEEYGIDIHRIKEIIKLRSITEIPRAPKFILGIITLRGTVIPVLDLRERLRLATAEFTRQNKIVVVHYHGQFFGLIVDSVIEVSRVPESSVEDTPSIMVGVEGRFIEGIGRAGKQMIILLKLDEVLDIDLKPAV